MLILNPSRYKREGTNKTTKSRVKIAKGREKVLYLHKGREKIPKK